MTANWTRQDLVALRFHSLSKKRLEISLLVLLFVKGFSGEVLANGGIVTDGSVGSQGFPSGAPGYLGSVHTLSPGGGSSDVHVTQSMGTTVGHNVFQSFSQFNISKGQIVTFEEDNKGFVDNVIARVSGKDVSQINGTLRVTPDGGHANFYLLNPNGVLFGNGASIDVPGDFHVTTAHFIKFQDGTKYGSDPVHSHLTSAAPASFGFTSGNKSNNVLLGGKGAIVVDGATLDNTTSQKSIDLVANKITIENGATIKTKSSGDPKEGGDIRLVAAKGDTNVTLKRDAYGNLELPKFAPTATNAGKVEVRGIVLDESKVNPDTGGHFFSSSVKTHGEGGGRIAMWGQQIGVRDEALVMAMNDSPTSANPSQGIHIKAHTVSVANGEPNNATNNSTITAYADAPYSGKSGNINIDASGDIYIREGLIQSGNNDTSFPGGIRLNSSNLSLSSESEISSKSYGHEEGSLTTYSGISLNVAGTLKMDGSHISLNGNYFGPSSPVVQHDHGININSRYLILDGSSIADNSFRPGHLGINIYSEYGITLLHKSSITEDSGGEFGNNAASIIKINSGSNLILSDRSRIETFLGGSINVKADTILLNNISRIGTASFNDDSGGSQKPKQQGSIELSTNGIFTSGNVLNGHLFPNTNNRIEAPGPNFKLRYGNEIAATGSSGEISISGSLLNLSGAMANLGTPSFESDVLSNSCDVIDKGSLMSGGKGGKGLNAMDRMIFGE